VEKFVPDQDSNGATAQGRRGSPGSLARRVLRRLAAGLGRPTRPRTSTELTTLPPPSRGQALREAHRTLRERLQSLPALRQVLPHLSWIERKLARRGSQAFAQLPVPVLQRGLEQLSMLQRDDETPLDAMNLRVLRLRLIEAIALRSVQPDAGASSRRQAKATSSTSATSGRHLESGAVSSMPAVEVSEVSSSAFGDATVQWADAAAQPKPPLRRH